MNDYEAHLSSYDHSHKQRLKDMKAMVRDPNAVAKARKAEAKADGIVSIKLDQDAPPLSSGSGGGGSGAGGGGSSGFKKGGFKKTGFKSAFAPAEAPTSTTASQSASADSSHVPANLHPHARMGAEEKTTSSSPVYKGSLVESDTEDEGYEVYDPKIPTD
jgi:hypothetical protein